MSCRHKPIHDVKAWVLKEVSRDEYRNYYGIAIKESGRPFLFESKDNIQVETRRFGVPTFKDDSWTWHPGAITDEKILWEVTAIIMRRSKKTK
jgi:hypothetical protein